MNASAPLADQRSAGTARTSGAAAPPGTDEAARGGWIGRLKGHAQIGAGVLVSAWSIWLLGKAADPSEIGRYLGGASWTLLALGFVSICVSMVIKAHRWRLLFDERTELTLEPLVSSLYIGYLANTVLPARVGEVVRAYLAGREPRVGLPVALATIVVEKILDLLTLGLVLAGLVVLQQLPYLPGWLQVSVVSTAVGFGGGLLALGLMLAFRARVLGLVGLVEARVPPLRRLEPRALVASFLDGLAALGRRDRLPAVAFWSVAVWASSAVTMWLGIAALGIDASPTAVLFSLVVTNLGMVVPSAPGYVGVFHALLVESLRPFGIDPNQALGAAILMHALVFGNFVLGGVWYLWRGGHSLRSLQHASRH